MIYRIFVEFHVDGDHVVQEKIHSLWSQAHCAKHSTAIAHGQSDVDRFDPFNCHFAEHVCRHSKNRMDKVMALTIPCHYIHQFGIFQKFDSHSCVWCNILFKKKKLKSIIFDERWILKKKITH